MTAIDVTLPSAPSLVRAQTPPAGPGVPRTRLLRRLRAGAATPIVLLRAPAGYGKTTLLAQWAAGGQRPCAWVAAAELRSGGAGAEAADVAAAIASALDASEQVAPAPLAVLRNAATLDRRLLRALAAALAARARPLLLVLDDAHLLRGPAAEALLELLARSLPSGSQLALGARDEPALPLARLRAERRLLELHARELALDPLESALLLAHAEPRLGAAQAAALAARAEGWPVALALLARALDERPVASALGGADRLLAAYVREQLLARLAPPARELLLRCAPLGTLSGELCDAVLARRDGGLVLRELAHGNVPLEALDRTEQRFRLHPLVAEALAAELRRTDAAWEARAHARASAWHARRGEPVRALDHAVAAGDAVHAGTLLWSGPPELVLGPGARLDAWLRVLGDEAVAETASLALAAAANHVAHARAGEAARLAAAAKRGPHDRAAAALVRAVLAQDGAAAMERDARAACAAGLPHPGWHEFGCLLAGVGAHLRGAAEPAREQLERGGRRPGAPAVVQALREAQLALLALDCDRRAPALALATRASARVRSGRAAQQPLAALVHATAAFAYAQGGALAQAREQLGRSRRVLPDGADLPSWYEVELRFARARTLLRLSDAAAARAELARMSRVLRHLHGAVAAQAWIEDAWARADAFAASAVAGPTRLTLAELRVLRLLPSHFSLREIAARLHVSANTVKTQAHAVYRKLDVSSRSEAVARAREIGLVDASYG